VGSVITAQGLAAQLVIRQWEKLYCVSLALHILDDDDDSYSFLCCLICLYLNPQVSLFVHSLPLPGGAASERLRGPRCQLPG